jgi:hypothetical protein
MAPLIPPPQAANRTSGRRSSQSRRCAGHKILGSVNSALLDARSGCPGSNLELAVAKDGAVHGFVETLTPTSEHIQRTL